VTPLTFACFTSPAKPVVVVTGEFDGATAGELVAIGTGLFITGGFAP
jgi:hypothetical protein